MTTEEFRTTTPADEVARRWRRVHELDRRAGRGGVEHELTIVEHLKFISAAYSDTAGR